MLQALTIDQLLRHDLQKGNVGSSATVARRRASPPFRQIVLRKTVHASVGRRSWCCSPDPSGRRRRARRPAHASLVRAWDPCSVAGGPVVVRPNMMECPWQQQDGGKNELTQNWWVLSRELGLWSSPAKLAPVGQARLRVSCVCWQQPRQGPNPRSFGSERSALGVPMGSDPELRCRTRVRMFIVEHSGRIWCRWGHSLVT